MLVSHRLRMALVPGALALLALTGASAQEPASKPTTPAGTADRLFLAFAQDAAIVPSQWWEGQIEYDDGSKDIPVDVLIGRAVVAFQPWKQLELGGRFGFGTTDASPPSPDGSGATDLDFYGKWVFPTVADKTDYTAGGLVTVPTGDDTAGLGFNAFGVQAFGAARHRLDDAIIGGHVGVRWNGDGDFQTVPISGKMSYELGFAVLFPLSQQVTLVGEAQIETARFEGADSAAQILAGIDWKAFGRGQIRAAIAGGLTDGAPDFRIFVGYAYTF